MFSRSGKSTNSLYAQFRGESQKHNQIESIVKGFMNPLSDRRSKQAKFETSISEESRTSD